MKGTATIYHDRRIPLISRDQAILLSTASALQSDSVGIYNHKLQQTTPLDIYSSPWTAIRLTRRNWVPTGYRPSSAVGALEDLVGRSRVRTRLCCEYATTCGKEACDELCSLFGPLC
jgi:hypothetical protein